MATAYSLASNDAILHCPIDLSFDLDEALTTITNTSEPDVPMDSGSQNIQQFSETNTELFLSNLPTVASTDGLICSVCMEDFQPAFPGKQVPCGHLFHPTCIATWISLCNSCPLCRSRCLISGDQ
ncbi:RING/U-box superfamily protein [Melia azedarach]|uniref:RING/U-box superfamily protein n=1 Tax=Melia azedarach TaxID=155640 RepID=A0ACC1XBJ3_MELAZ|nr:RING/U-box superfamily protein [Melia azedarach]